MRRFLNYTNGTKSRKGLHNPIKNEHFPNKKRIS